MHRRGTDPLRQLGRRGAQHLSIEALIDVGPHQ
jgi:hypothetical protein